VLTVVEDEESLLQALKLGARGYVLKGTGGADLVSVLRAVVAGETYVTPQMAGRLLKELTQKRPQTPGMAELSERERGVLELVSGCLTNKEIADRLFLSEKTVKHYMTNILDKLQVRNRVDAALLARERRENLAPSISDFGTEVAGERHSNAQSDFYAPRAMTTGRFVGVQP